MRAYDERVSRYANGSTKRAFDVVAALLCLVLLGLPVLVVMLAVALRLRTRPWFVQRRIGRDGRRFDVFKIRTLPRDFDPNGAKPTEDETRELGRFLSLLRASGFDELPQVLNVLRGEMSFVGPRPEMEYVTLSYGERCRRRLAVRPGLTGLWQVEGDHRAPIHAQLRYDLLYLRKASLGLDLWIVLQTAFAVVTGHRRPRRLARLLR